MYCLITIQKPLKRIPDINVFGYGCNVAFSPDSKLMAFAIPSDDESQELSKLNVYDIFAPTTNPL